MTALYDAIGYTVDRYKNTDVGSTTIVAILTDGEENSSHKYNGPSVQKLLKDVQEELEWEVMFLGANLDVRGFATAAGIKLNNTTAYEYSKKGLRDVLRSASYKAGMTRGMGYDLGGGVMMNASNADSLGGMSALYSATASSVSGELNQVESVVVGNVITGLPKTGLPEAIVKAKKSPDAPNETAKSDDKK
jgi:hypothetical protein